MAGPAAESLAQRQIAELRRGWRVLLACTIGLSLGVTLYGFVASLFVSPLEQSFGWSRASIAGVLLAVPVATLALPFIGAWIDRAGAPRIVAISTAGLCLGYILLAQLGSDIRAYYAAYAAAILLGAATGPIAYARVLVTWFVAARGTAMALMLAGGSLATIVIAPSLSAVIEQHGFRTGFMMLAALAAVGGLAAIALGLPNGPLAESTATDTGIAVKIRLGRRFWLLAGAILLAGVPAIGLASQLQPLFRERGFGQPQAAAMISVLAAAILGGRLATGFLIDRVWPPVVAASVMVLAALGAVLLALDGLPAWTAVLGVALVGLSQGAELDLLSVLCARYFGLAGYARTYGMLFLAYSLALPTGAWLFGFAHDRTGHYALALWVSAALLVASALLFLILESARPATKSLQQV